MKREQWTHLKSKVEDKEFTVFSTGSILEPTWLFDFRHELKVKMFKRKYKKSLTK